MTVNFITAQVRDFVIRIFRTRRRERLIRNYFFVSVILIAGGLISAGCFRDLLPLQGGTGTDWSHAARRRNRGSLKN